jgi:glycosyltransferase involved in cell wall biosynthesis
MRAGPGRRRILLAGTFEPDFARNRVLAALLERSGFQVETVQRSLWGPTRYSLLDGPKAVLLLRAVRAYASLLRALLRVPRPDAILVLYPGYFDMPLVGAIAKLRRVPVVFDIFISLHDTVAVDRALRDADSLLGRLTASVDRIACRFANLILADTPTHADYFAKLTRVPRERFRVLWLGAREDVFAPRAGTSPEPRLVTFHGTFIPLQGLETIVRAAKLLEPDGVRVRIIGDGQERPRIEELIEELRPANVELTGVLPVERVPDEIAAASLCLGIFGTTPKAARVVPNKLFECLAMARPVVTADTPAIRSAFDGEVAVVPAGDPDALAAAIRRLLADEHGLRKLAEAGHERYVRDYSEAALAAQLRRHVDELLA